MRQFLNFPNGQGRYKNQKINVDGLLGAYYVGPGEAIVNLPLNLSRTMAINLELGGSDQSDARYEAFVDSINSAFVANPGGTCIDIAETISNMEITNL
jgi:hypothetical protein